MGVLHLLFPINDLFNLIDDIFKVPFHEFGSRLHVRDFLIYFDLMDLVHKVFHLNFLDGFLVESIIGGLCEISIHLVFQIDTHFSGRAPDIGQDLFNDLWSVILLGVSYQHFNRRSFIVLWYFHALQKLF